MRASLKTSTSVLYAHSSLSLPLPHSATMLLDFCGSLTQDPEEIRALPRSVVVCLLEVKGPLSPSLPLARPTQARQSHEIMVPTRRRMVLVMMGPECCCCCYLAGSAVVLRRICRHTPSVQFLRGTLTASECVCLCHAHRGTQADLSSTMSKSFGFEPRI